LRGQKFLREKFAETKVNEQTFGEVRFVLRRCSAILTLSPLLLGSQGFFFFFSFLFFSLERMAVVGFIAGKACDCGGKAFSLGLGVEGIQGNAEGGLFRMSE